MPTAVGGKRYQNGLLKLIQDSGVGRRTSYEYDANGNRTRETYADQTQAGDDTYYQDTRIAYDELLRI